MRAQTNCYGHSENLSTYCITGNTKPPHLLKTHLLAATVYPTQKKQTAELSRAKHRVAKDSLEFLIYCI